MKKQSFLKEYGDLPVQIYSLSSNHGLKFEGIFYKDQKTIINITLKGDLNNLSIPIYVENNYTVKYIVENFPEFDITVFVDVIPQHNTISYFFKSRV